MTSPAWKYRASFSDDGSVRIRRGSQPLVGAAVYLNEVPIVEAFWRALSGRLADWGDIAVAVYGTDRLCRRPPDRTGASWSREIHLQVPVRELDFWCQQSISSAIVTLLEFLTDDTWTLEFVPRQTQSAPIQQRLFEYPVQEPAFGALFSGGLDSLAGVVAFLTENPDVHLAMFSAHTSTRVTGPQRVLISRLKGLFRDRIRPADASFGLHNRKGHKFDHEERSQRTRGFAFQVLGAIAANCARAGELLVFENGVGAINLPYLQSQIGSQATRATNPVTLNMMSRLATDVMDSEFRIRLPFLLRTKAELCKSLRSENFTALIAESISCDHFPQRTKLGDQCGACSSCILRKQALHGVGLSGFDRAPYVHRTGQGSGPKQDGWFVLRAMDAQVRQLQGLLAQEEPSQLHRTFPSLVETQLALESLGVSPADIRSLLQRYVAEWATFRETIPALQGGS